MTVHYSLIQFFFWFSYGATVSFASVYLLSNGATNTVCGIVSAVASALSVFIQPWVASYADREDSLSVKALVLILDGLMLSFPAGDPFSTSTLISKSPLSTLTAFVACLSEHLMK